jgi:hypothetical protein
MALPLLRDGEQLLAFGNVRFTIAVSIGAGWVGTIDRSAIVRFL